MDSTASANEIQPGDSLHWYRVDRVLGTGNSSITYLATDTKLEHQVAIKEYFPSDIATRDGNGHVYPITKEHGETYRSGLKHFAKVALTLARLNHPHIVHVMSAFKENNTAYMVMRFEEGVVLRTYLHKREHACEDEINSLVLPIAKGLFDVHRFGFLHFNINPGNILVRNDGTPVLLNFGSTRIDSKLTPQSLNMPSPVGYAAPEQFNFDYGDQMGPWTDIFALGGVLYFAISGIDPIDSRRRTEALFSGGPDPLISAVVIGKDKYSESFLNTVDWALKLRIDDRPQSLSDWITIGTSDEEWPYESPDEWSDMLSNTLGVPTSPDHPSSAQDPDATGQFNDIVFRRVEPTASQSPKNRIIGFPIISIVTILILLVTIIATIATSE